MVIRMSTKKERGCMNVLHSKFCIRPQKAGTHPYADSNSLQQAGTSPAKQNFVF